MNESTVERSKGYAIVVMVMGLVLCVGVNGLIPSESWQMPLWLAVFLTSLGLIGFYGVDRLRRLG